MTANVGSCNHENLSTPKWGRGFRPAAGLRPGVQGTGCRHGALGSHGFSMAAPSSRSPATIRRNIGKRMRRSNLPRCHK
jgi:hypothetical protein